MAQLNLIALPADLIQANARILGMADEISRQAGHGHFSGVVHNGHTSVKATIAPGAPGKIDLSFSISVPSVTSPAFASLRHLLTKLLPASIPEATIAQQAGIGPAPPPEASKMAAYASQLFADLFFGGTVPEDQNRAFAAQGGPDHQIPVINSVRNSSVDDLSLDGTLSISAETSGAEAEVYIPTTAIVFDDGLTIPFSGYSETAIVGIAQTLVPTRLPLGLWTGPEGPSP